LGEVDVSYVVGLAVSAGVYWVLARSMNPAEEAPAIAESEELLEGGR